jgi:hypothetical protein
MQGGNTRLLAGFRDGPEMDIGQCFGYASDSIASYFPWFSSTT